MFATDMNEENLEKLSKSRSSQAHGHMAKVGTVTSVPKAESIPNEFRCRWNDGNQWRCNGRALPERCLCQKHHLQQLVRSQQALVGTKRTKRAKKQEVVVKEKKKRGRKPRVQLSEGQNEGQEGSESATNLKSPGKKRGWKPKIRKPEDEAQEFVVSESEKHVKRKRRRAKNDDLYHEPVRRKKKRAKNQISETAVRKVD